MVEQAARGAATGAALAEALTHEHHEIDAGIGAFAASLDAAAAGGDPIEVDVLRGALDGLRRHIYLEEVFLFPPIRAAGLMMPIMVMLREHAELWQRMDRIEQLVDAQSADPAESADRRTTLITTCRELLALLDQHNSKEEPIIYPRAGVDLSGKQREELATLLQTGRTPEGWVCQGS